MRVVVDRYRRATANIDVRRRRIQSFDLSVASSATDRMHGGVVEIGDVGVPAQPRPFLVRGLQTGDPGRRDRPRFEAAVLGDRQSRLYQRRKQILPARLLLRVSGAKRLVVG